MAKPRYSNLKDWLQWQESLHGQEIDLGLSRIRNVCQLMLEEGVLSLPFKVITVAGTNGKGSTIAFLNAIYQQAGYSVGQFTSPHFLRYNERIQVNSQAVEDQALCDAFAAIDDARGDINLTYFEFSTLAALFVFAQQNMDIVLLEVGLGGRLDASNVIDADCAIVTSIGIDHRDWLGDTREEIGYEKAGIFRQGKPAICGDMAIPSSVKQHANNIGADWYGRGEQFEMEQSKESWTVRVDDRGFGNLPYPSLLAPIQLNNAACAVVAVHVLQPMLPISDKAVQQAIRITQVPGRMQSICQQPQVILDVAHNEDAAKAVVAGIQRINADKPVHVVLGMLADKEVQATVDTLAALKPVGYLAAPVSHRAMQVEQLQKHVEEANWNSIQAFDSIFDAYQAAVLAAGKEGIVLVVGSFFTVAEVMKAEV